MEMGSFSNPDVTMAIQPLSLEEARDLFYQLGVPRKTLDSITAQYSSDTCKEQLVQVWLDSDADASWDKFFSGLQFISSEVPSTAMPPLGHSTAELSTALDYRVSEVKTTIENLEDEFFNMMSNSQVLLSERDGKFYKELPS